MIMHDSESDRLRPIEVWIDKPRRQLNEACRRGEVPAVKIGQEWMMSARMFESWIASLKSPGVVTEEAAAAELRKRGLPAA